VAFGIQFTIWSTLITTFTVGFAYQSSKVCMDSVVQADSDDAYVGRVFALYDTLNNLAYVLAFCIGIFIVPPAGNGPAAVFLVSAVFLVTGVGYGMAMSRLRRAPSRPDQAPQLAHDVVADQAPEPAGSKDDHR